MTHVGYKIGELFIKLAIGYALLNNINEIYLTHFINQKDELISLIDEYGFKHISDKGEEKKEAVFMKRLVLPIDEIKTFSAHEISNGGIYPMYFDGQRVNKYIVPIRPEYHVRLYTDAPYRQTTIEEHQGDLIVEGNTIKKAYLCHPRTKKIKKGDLLLFYRSHDQHAITSLGVVDSIMYDLTDPKEVQKHVGKRTVYSKNEIIEMTKKPVTVILFRHHFHFARPFTYSELIKEGILFGPPQSISTISHENYRLIKKRSGIDGRFAFD